MSCHACLMCRKGSVQTGLFISLANLLLPRIGLALLPSPCSSPAPPLNSFYIDEVAASGLSASSQRSTSSFFFFAGNSMVPSCRLFP